MNAECSWGYSNVITYARGPVMSTNYSVSDSALS